ncbi:MAG: hypothetical protein IPN33_25760 [Saprospiraceae bacterium]|nr:hypothetical protein [Saprospiraceae bacterium]
MAANDLLNLVIRLQPSGQELDVELSKYTTGKEIVEELLRENLAPRSSAEGEPFIYELSSKTRGVTVEENKCLMDVGIVDGDTLFFVPKLVAG